MAKSKGTKPVVFYYQPTKFLKVPAAKLKAWENDLRNKVGFKGTIADTSTPTTSCCPEADDCDQD
jgi:hypothetical protein